MDCVLSCSITLVQAWVLKVLKSLVSRLRGNDVTSLDSHARAPLNALRLNELFLHE